MSKPGLTRRRFGIRSRGVILEITPAARADLLEQFRHYHFDLDLPEVAQRWLAGVEAAFDRILGMPKIGSPQEVSNPAFPGLRAWPVPSFEDLRIYYLADDSRILVIRVLHEKRDVQRILEGE